jgi:hypothetical protein
MKQLNLNTLILGILTALFIWGLNKADKIKEQVDDSSRHIVLITASQKVMADQVSEMRGQMKDMVLKSDFQAEIGRLTREIEGLKRRP